MLTASFIKDAMAQNDIFMLDRTLQARHKSVAPDMSDSDFFELFVSEELLKNRGLDYQEIEDGVVDGGGDGGIDAIYLFVDEKLLTSIDELESARQNATLELVIIQAKYSPGFQEAVIKSLVTTLNELLVEDADPKELHKQYNSKLVSAFNDFHDAVKALAARFPNLKFSFYYASKGDSSEVHPNVTKRTKTLNDTIDKYFTDCKFSFKFIGARDLVRLARRQSERALNLKITKYLSGDDGGYV